MAARRHKRGLLALSAGGDLVLNEQEPGPTGGA